MSEFDRAGFDRLLDDGAQALRRPLAVEQRAQLLDYLALLLKWNRVYNLTSIDDPGAAIRSHLLDSYALAVAIDARYPKVESLSLLDVGSGGGLPGVVLAIAEPRWQVLCVDTVGKKTRFITQVSAELGLPNLQASHSRVEQLQAPPQDLITSRAFSALDAFVSLTRPLLRSGGAWVAMKGRYPEAEAAALPSDVRVFHVEHPQIPGLDAERCLVWMQAEG